MEQFEIAIILIILLTFFICVPVLCLKCNQTINERYYNYYKTGNTNTNTEIQKLIIR
jgi:hypothetical protein